MMTDTEYPRFMEAHIAAAFFPPFGGRQFFNRALFDYILDQAGSDVDGLNREMSDVNNRWSGPNQSVKMRADNGQKAIKLKIYTPTGCTKVAISSDGVISREMEPTE